LRSLFELVAIDSGDWHEFSEASCAWAVEGMEDNKPYAYDPDALQQETFHGKEWYPRELMPLRSSQTKKALGETQLEPFQAAAYAGLHEVEWA
jgi:hypothetical protein